MTAALNNLLAPIGSLESYVAAVNRVPMLSEADERALAERYQNENDLGAARQLVLSHLRFVVRVARVATVATAYPRAISYRKAVSA